MTKREQRQRTEAALLAIELAARRTLRRGLRLILGHHAAIRPDDPVGAAVAAGRDLEAVVARQVVVARQAAGRGGVAAVRRELDLPRIAPAPTKAGPVGSPYRGYAPWPPPGSGIAAETIGARAGELLVQRAGAATLAEARPAVESRLDTIAATETAAAFHQGREAAVRDAVDAAALVEDEILMQWSSVLDRATCALCGSLHGELAPLGRSFPGGYVPGLVHARCRCIAFPVRRAATRAA